jgi:hypothetical protein
MELGLILLKGVENEISLFFVQSGYDNSPTIGKFTQPDKLIPEHLIS